MVPQHGLPELDIIEFKVKFKTDVMKNLMLLAGILFIMNSHGQGQESLDTSIQMPHLIMVNSDKTVQTIDEYLRNNVQYPETSVERRIQGTEVIQFTINPKGRLTKFKVINSLSREIDKELYRVLRMTSGKWKPGIVEGIPVEMQQEISVNFFIDPKQFIIADAKDYLEKGNKLMYSKNKPRRAIYFYNKGITLLPNDETLLAARSLCKYRLGDKDGANQDWERLIILAKRNGTGTDQENLAIIPDNEKEFNELLLEIIK